MLKLTKFEGQKWHWIYVIRILGDSQEASQTSRTKPGPTGPEFGSKNVARRLILALLQASTEIQHDEFKWKSFAASRTA